MSLDTARARAAEFVRTVTEFDDGHREFLDQLELGQLRPEVLAQEQVRDRVAANPALLWRLQRGTETLEER